MIGWLRDAAVILYREWLRYRRDRAYWVGQIVFPFAVVAVVGLGMNGIVRLPDERSYVEYLASGVLALVVGSGAVGGGFSLIEDRQKGFLRALRVAPVSCTGIVLGKLAARLLASLVLLAVLIGLMSLATPIRVVHPAAVLGAVTAVTAIFVALGIALAARLRRLESFRLLAAGVTIPLYLLSGIFSPVESLPWLARLLAYLNPLTWGVDLLRYGLLGSHALPLVPGVVALTLLTLGSIGIAVRAFEAGEAA